MKLWISFTAVSSASTSFSTSAELRPCASGVLRGKACCTALGSLPGMSPVVAGIIPSGRLLPFISPLPGPGFAPGVELSPPAVPVAPGVMVPGELPGLFANGWDDGIAPDPPSEELHAAPAAARIIQLPNHRFIDLRFMAGDGP